MSELYPSSRERNEHDTAMGHVVVGVAASVAFIALASLSSGLLGFSLTVVVFYLALRSFTHAISIRLGDAWGWSRENGATSSDPLSDRAVLALVHWLRGRSAPVGGDEPPGAVRVLPPE